MNAEYEKEMLSRFLLVDEHKNRIHVKWEATTREKEREIDREGEWKKAKKIR